MEVHTFRAASLQEALQQVRYSLGPDASVLNTRELRQRRLGFFSKTWIEVVATQDMPVASRFTAAVQQPASKPSSRATVHPQRPSATSPSGSESASPPAREPLADVERNEPAHRAPPATTSATPSATRSAALSSSASSGDSAWSVADKQRLPPSPSPLSEQFRWSPAMLEVLSELLDGGVDPHVAKELMCEAGTGSTETQALDPWLIRGKLHQIVASKISVTGCLEPIEGKQRIVAVVGPTGVGKTTTVAKIAAGLRMDQGCRIGLITLDTFRPGAVDQLLQYAELVSASLEVVSSPDQVTPALQRLNQCDLVLLDTAGRSPRDSAQLALLRSFLQCAEPTATHLVLSATSSVACVRETVKSFSLLEPTSVIITKLDEAASFGSWLSFLCQSQLPVSYLTAGQNVPRDIAIASTRRLASLLLMGVKLARN